MQYIPASSASDGRAKVIYQSKNGRERKVFSALDWLAQLTTHIPNRREHMVRYAACPAVPCGSYHSNKSRGQRKKADQDDLSACDAQAGDGFFSQIPDYGYWAD
ncbi:MAG: hypothetical protein SWH68_09385 [Thermodesulfobacteriota bacterium]|nr:hypothetical protein [Thermodesulfobacteriota bacterium]